MNEQQGTISPDGKPEKRLLRHDDRFVEPIQKAPGMTVKYRQVDPIEGGCSKMSDSGEAGTSPGERPS